MTDMYGNKPEMFMVESNRSAGKTTYFQRLVVNRFLKHGKKFAILYRYKDELQGNIGDKFFKDIQGLFFQDYFLRADRKEGGTYYEFFIGDIHNPADKGVSAGYAFAINSADRIKRLSHLFSDVDSILFDEFQSENNTYVPNEIQKLLSLHTSISRGQGEQKRYVPIYMMSNPVSLINPYYTKLGISDRLNQDTKFLRGDGFVLEHGFNENASQAQLSSGVAKAFADDDYIAYSAQGVYLNDNLAFIEQPEGFSRYICTLRYEGKDYALREFAEQGIIYCDDKADKTFRGRISVTTDDHRVNYVMLKRNDFFLSQLRELFEQGSFRFKNLQCKEVVIKALSY